MPDSTNIPNNLGIDKALKEFEAKQNAEQFQKVPEIAKISDVPKMVQLVMKWSGLEQKQAEYALLGIVLIIFLISGFIFYNSSTTNKAEQISFPRSGE